MIRRANECSIEYREHMRDGDGTVKVTNLISGPQEMYDKGRLFAVITVEPGCSVGYHEHENDAELYYVVKGTGEYNDNGSICTVEPGDVTFCPAGSGHSIANKGTETLELIALIVYA